MMLPARTDCPPNFFTPRRLLSLSRPLRDEPPAFLCAMSNYFAFGLFLALALAGAAFFVAAALLEHRHLVGLGLGDDLRRDGQALGRLEVRPVAGEQDVAQRDAVARIAVELLDDDLVSRGNAILLAARAHDCEHWLFSSLKN